MLFSLIWRCYLSKERRHVRSPHLVHLSWYESDPEVNMPMTVNLIQNLTSTPAELG